MGLDSGAYFKGVRKADLKKLNSPTGYDWTDYYDLDYWISEKYPNLEQEDDGGLVLTEAVLNQLHPIILNSGFGSNPEIDAEFRQQTLEFISDGLLAIGMGGTVIYTSDSDD